MDNLPVWLSTMILGLGAVFIGLICLILITRLMSIICAKLDAKQKAVPAAPAAPRAAIADQGAFYAAVASCIASVMGAQVDGLRIVSVKQMD